MVAQAAAKVEAARQAQAKQKAAAAAEAHTTAQTREWERKKTKEAAAKAKEHVARVEATVPITGTGCTHTCALFAAACSSGRRYRSAAPMPSALTC